jgi:hypothetical protein
LGIAALEDKVVQHAVGTVLNQIWEEDFLGFSYGFRPGRSQHEALDALYVGITRKKVNWVLDLDIRTFFDKIDHDWMIRFVEHRIGDQRIVRLIQKWLKAGVMEQGSDEDLVGAGVRGVRSHVGGGISGKQTWHRGQQRDGTEMDDPGGKLWRAKNEKVQRIHVWRPRRDRRGELVQWDTSEHDWLEGRG